MQSVTTAILALNGTSIIVALIGVVGLCLQGLIIVLAAGIKREVKTANGMSIGKLADNVEGRRILADITHDERTTSEQQYVDRLSEKDSQRPSDRG